MKVLIIGAGFSGLTLAHRLIKKQARVDIYERGARVGGLIQTLITPFGPVETAANGFISSPVLREICADIGLPWVTAQRTSRKRYIVRDGQPRRWPLTGIETVTAGLKFLSVSRRARPPRDGETIREWGTRVIGEPATRWLLEPALSGIYAGSGDRLSASLTIGPLFKKRARRRLGARGELVSFDGGMGAFIHALNAWLEEKRNDVCFLKEMPELDWQRLAYDAVVFCGPAWEVPAWLDSVGLQKLAMAKSLADVESLPLVSVTVFGRGASSARDGFGCLFPASENFKSLGVLFNHRIFSERIRTPAEFSETWILGGDHLPGISNANDSEIMDFISQDRDRLGLAGSVIHSQITRWPQALPYYSIQLEALNLKSYQTNNIYIHGNYIAGIGLSRILQQSEAIATEIGQRHGPK